jgi:SH3 domain protein
MLFMKLLKNWIILLGVCLLLFSGNIYAETKYVTDVLRLSLRSGQSIQHKIIAVIESGRQVDVLESGVEWSLVRLPDEREGWVLTRYLTSDLTHNIRLARLETKHKNLTAQASALLEENAKLKQDNKRLDEQLAANQNTLIKTSSEFESLKADSAEFLNLKTKYDTAAAQLADKTKKLAKLEEQLSKIQLYHYIKWFLAGSGVLLVGFIIGFSAKRQRRRPSLL